jgi:hypothetical protein
MGNGGGGCAIVSPVVARERVALTRIAADRCTWLAGLRRFDLSLRRFGYELLLTEVHQQRSVERVHLMKVLLCVPAVLGDGGVHVAALGRQEGH